jgi:hypothetical protein
MERLDLEFRRDGLTRGDLDLLDAHYQHRRWSKAKERALLREMQREKTELKEKTVKLIEEQVEQTQKRL